MAKVFYKGFSTKDWINRRNFSLTNIDLVKEDLLNHIWTTVGERVMMPDFGTRIPLLTFEPLDDETLAIIEKDLRKVFAYDPRVELLELSILPLLDNNAIFVLADLFYREFNVRDTLKIEIKR